MHGYRLVTKQKLIAELGFEYLDSYEGARVCWPFLLLTTGEWNLDAVSWVRLAHQLATS